MNTTDDELLTRYARDSSEAAFAELVRRHINLVYSAALRQVNGNVHQAEDVTQAVFTNLARKAAKLTSHPSITGWLYTTTRFEAANIRRSGERRNIRDQEAHAMTTILNAPESEPDWLLELTTRKDDFADTQLSWRPPNGQMIPSNYILRIDRPIAIGGTVVDADGKPVAGAKVSWGQEDDPTALKLPQNHNFIHLETTTAQDGRWQINRMAEDTIPLICGKASHSDDVNSPIEYVSQNKTMEEQLRNGKFIFQLGRAATVTGTVVDNNGSPVPDANILIGSLSESGRRSGKTADDGTFSVHGCRPGTQLVPAHADAFAATTIDTDANISPNLVDVSRIPFHLILKPGAKRPMFRDGYRIQTCLRDI